MPVLCHSRVLSAGVLIRQTSGKAGLPWSRCYSARMRPEGWTTVGTVLAMVIAMAFDLVGPDMALVAGLTLLLATGVLVPEEAFSGFSNPAVATIAALFVVAAGVRETGALDFVARRVLGTPKGTPSAQLRVMAPVGVLSGFLNNTPVVAMFVPLIQRWSKQIAQPVSFLLMPLSYAAILGGMCTLIGTSTSLLVAGMYEARVGATLGVFDITPLGVPVFIVGTAYMLLVSSRLLRRGSGVDAMSEDAKEYAIAFRVSAGSPVVGQTIEECLRSLPKLFLFEMERDGELFPAVKPSTKLRADDILVFAGIIVDAAVDLRKKGLVPAGNQLEKLKGRSERTWVEAVVAASGPLNGKTVRESRFRTEYNAAIIAVHREGARVSSKVGDIYLQPGDMLLIEAAPAFVRKYRTDPSFVLVAAVAGSEAPKHEKAWIAGGILAMMVATNASGLFSLLTGSLLAAGMMLVTRCITGPQARAALDLRVLVTVGAAIGLGVAVENSGAATVLSDALVSSLASSGTLVLMAVIFGVTALLSGFVYTATSAALMFPIAAQVAEAANIPLLPMTLLVIIAACSAFSSPIGYAANLMVYGPGGYRYRDFLKVGLPLQILVGAVTLLVLHYGWLT